MDNKQKEFQKWLKKQPFKIQELSTMYPPGKYKMKEKSPYALSCAGTLVSLYSYHDDGEISVVVEAKDKLQEALDHEKELCAQYGKDPEEAHNRNIICRIDPKWLEKIN